MKPDNVMAVALEDSIIHWRENITLGVEGASIAMEDCALCQMYYDRGECTNCPVRKKTGRKRCNGTPYYEAAHYLDQWDIFGDSDDELMFLECARAELAFLESLRGIVKDGWEANDGS